MECLPLDFHVNWEFPVQMHKKYMDLYFQRYPGVQQFMTDIREKAKAQGYVETLFGRRLYLPDINSSNAMRRKRG